MQNHWLIFYRKFLFRILATIFRLELVARYGQNVKREVKTEENRSQNG